MSEDIKRLLEQGKAAFDKRDYKKALTIFTEVLRQSSGFADVYNMIGIIFHEQGNHRAARNAFKHALEINPNFADAALNLMITLNDMGVPQEERKAEFDSLKVKVPVRNELDDYLKAKLANKYAEIGRIYLSVGKADLAIAEFERALELKPEYFDIRLLLATALKEKGDLRAAIAECRSILSSRPDMLDARTLLGLCFHMQGEDENAIREWKKVLEKNPEHRLAKIYLSTVEEREENEKESLDDVP